MLKVTTEGNEIVIRVNSGLVDSDVFSELLGHIGFQLAVKTKTRAELGEAPAVGRRRFIWGFRTGLAFLRDPALNKGSAFTQEEREALGLRGLLPLRAHSMDEQVVRVLGNLRRRPTDLGKYMLMTSLEDRNRTLFYRVLLDNIEELMPYDPSGKPSAGSDGSWESGDH